MTISKDEIVTLLTEIILNLGTAFREVDKKEVLELAEYNECKIAVETLCTQLYEFDVKLNDDEFYKINMLSKELKLDSKYFDWLKELIE